MKSSRTYELPNHFTDEQIIRVQSQTQTQSQSSGAAAEENKEKEVEEDSNDGGHDWSLGELELKPCRYPLTMGLLTRLCTGMQRVVKRSICRAPIQGRYEQRFESLLRYYAVEADLTRALGPSMWTIECLLGNSDSLSKKCTNLSLELQRRFDEHPLLPPTSDGRFAYSNDFLLDVAEYHKSLSRPEDVFASKAESAAELALLEGLARLDREECPCCTGRKQIYCGACGGCRMPGAEALLPARITALPFDVLLAVHWQESLHKCTGVHAAALCAQGSVALLHWERERTDPAFLAWVGSLDPAADVLLFPSEGAVDAEHFPWRTGTRSGDKWRLVVLEASWTNGKKMARQLQALRRQLGVPPLPCVTLSGVVGRYWRFHEEGLAAVSTIEAIAHAAAAAGMQDDMCERLLLLFRLQRLRVLSHVEAGGRAPRAMQVSGAGAGGWAEDRCIAVPTDTDDGTAS